MRDGLREAPAVELGHAQAVVEERQLELAGLQHPADAGVVVGRQKIAERVGMAPGAREVRAVLRLQKPDHDHVAHCACLRRYHCGGLSRRSTWPSQSGGRRRIALRHTRVVAGDDQIARARQPADAPIALQHAGEVVEDGERALLVHLLEHVHGVGGEDHPAAGGVDAQDGLPPRVSADQQVLEPRRQRGVAFVEHHALRVDEIDQRLDILGMIGGAEGRVRHVAPGDVDHLLVLDVEARLGIVLQRADMIEMRVRQDHVGLAGRLDADPRQGLAGPAYEVVLSTHALRLALRHAGIDDPRPASAPERVREEVEALDHLIAVAAEEHVRFRTLVLLGVADGVDFVLGQLGHRRSPEWPQTASSGALRLAPGTMMPPRSPISTLPKRSA